MGSSDPADLGQNARDRFAFQAMNGLLAKNGTAVKPAVVARTSYEIADAMMALRGDDGPISNLRDRIAEQALNGLVGNQGTAVKAAIVARMSYEIADAFIAQRGAKTAP